MWSSSSWLSEFSCSSSAVIEPTSSVPLVIQWLRFLSLSPCPQRVLFSILDLVFLLTFVLLKLFPSSAINTNADIRKPLITNPGRIQPRVTSWFKTTVIISALLSFSSALLCVFSFFGNPPTPTPWNLLDPIFWLIHALTNAVITVYVLRQKRFAALNHHSSLRVYWISSFVVSTLFVVSGVFHLFSDDAARLRAQDIASFISFPFTAFLLIVSVRGTTGLVTEEENNSPRKSGNVSLYASASAFSKMFWLWMNPLLKKGYQSPLTLDQVPTLSPEHKAERLALLFESSWPKPSENSSHPVRTTLIRCFWKEILFTAILAIVRLCVMYVGPVLIQSFVDFTSGKRSSPLQGYLLSSMGFQLKTNWQ